MPWLFLLLAIAALAVAMNTASKALAVICMLAALVLLVIWVMGLVAQRVGSRARDTTQMIDPLELRRLREQPRSRRATSADDSTPGS